MTSGHDLFQQACNLQARKHLPDAEIRYRQVLTTQPEHVEAWNNLGNLLKELGRLAEAKSCFDRAVALRPDHPDIRNNLGVLLHEMGRFAEAESEFQRTLQAVPHHIEAWNNLGNLLKEIRYHDEAESAYRRVLALRPDHPEARWNLSLLLLLRGDYHQAWPLHESRYDPRRQEHEILYPTLPTPRWQGESLKGKRLLIWNEQGMGDEIQFCRFAPLVRHRFAPAHVTLSCKSPLMPLLRTASGIDEVCSARDPLPPHDLWCFPGSLPLFCGVDLENLPNRLPYLAASPDHLRRWEGLLSSRLGGEALRVALVWAGNRLHKNDAHRSLPSLRLLAPLWRVPGVRFISLQHGRPDDPALAEAQTPPNDQPMLHLGSSVRNFADTAAIVARTDLVICVDTALAHLAGALARPCWVMLPWLGGDWRWLENRGDSPWYPGAVRLFRQAHLNGWPETIQSVTTALSQWAAAKASQRRSLSELSKDDIRLVALAAKRMKSTDTIAP